MPALKIQVERLRVTQVPDEGDSVSGDEPSLEIEFVPGRMILKTGCWPTDADGLRDLIRILGRIQAKTEWEQVR